MSLTKLKKTKKSKNANYLHNQKNEEHLNLKPSSLEQTLTKRMEEFAQIKNASKNPMPKKRKRNKFSLEYIEPDQPKWKKKKGESDEKFLRRVDRDTHNYVQKVQFEEEFQINKKKDVLDEDSRKKENNKPSKSSRKKKEKKDKLRNKRSEKINSKTDDFKKMKDVVKFGEVVLAPPSLNKDSKMKSSSLLLAKKFTGEKKEAGKSKALSAEMEEERRKVIEFYRMNKRKKYANRAFHSDDLVS